MHREKLRETSHTMARSILDRDALFPAPAPRSRSMWGCAEELAAELREGAVFKVTHLVPQKHKP